MHKTKPSRTARKVAIGVVALDAMPEMKGKLPDGIGESTSKLVLAARVVRPLTLRIVRSKAMLLLYRSLDWIIPGQFKAIGSRKAFCDQQVRQVIQQGTKQVLVLGAGYDTLCWRLAPEFSDVRFFEVDHPATSERKRMGIDALEQEPNLTLISANLESEKLVDVLHRTESWDSNATTIFVAEGLLMYLDRTDVESLFRQCAEISGNKSRFAFSYVRSAKDGRPDLGWMSGLLRWSLARIGEPMRWSERVETIGDFLDHIGWRQCDQEWDSTKRFGIECFVVAERPAKSNEHVSENSKR